MDSLTIRNPQYTVDSDEIKHCIRYTNYHTRIKHINEGQVDKQNQNLKLVNLRVFASSAVSMKSVKRLVILSIMKKDLKVKTYFKVIILKSLM